LAEFLKEPIVSALREAGRPLKPRELARALGIDSRKQRRFERFLEGLVEAGELYRVKQGRFAPPDRINLVVGHLSVIRSGAAFLVPDRGGDDIYISADARANATHGDKVVVRVEHRRRDRPEGRVVRVLERAHSEFVGTVRRTPRFVSVSPDDPRSPKDIFVPVAEAGEARDGEVVRVEIVDWGSARSSPVGRISEILGMPGDPGLDVLMIIKHNGLPTELPPEVESAAKALPDRVPEAEVAERVDLREIPVVTIDPATAKDFDDALSLAEREDGNLELGVHIADVSHYVRFGDAIDQEARARGTSVYLVDRVLPMLPEKLSNHLCSLKPHEDRLTMSVRIGITPRGRILDYRIEDTVICSMQRLTYEEVQRHFDGKGSLSGKPEALLGLLDRLRALAAVLHSKRIARGALDFDLPESRVELDEEGFPVDIQKVARLESHRLVEEFMLLANEVVARHLKKTRTPGLYRAHEEPPESKLAQLGETIARFGYVLRFDAKGRVPPRELQRILLAAEGRPEEFIIHTLVLRSLARACYDVGPLGHYGLALKDYAHFTSPIRRYPDLLVHRALRVLSGKQEPPKRERAEYQEWLSDTALLASDRERIAESAERDSVELKKIQFMERHVGDVFPGVVAGVEAFGFFVELERYHVSGLVHVSTLEDDYYEFREDEVSLRGENTGRRFTLGDRVTVQVVAVKKELRQIDFLLVSEQTQSPPLRRPERPRRPKRQKGRGQRVRRKTHARR
jgi:ribonuclease R